MATRPLLLRRTWVSRRPSSSPVENLRNKLILCSTKPLLVLYGDETPELLGVKQVRPNVTALKIQMNHAFATHHSKVMLLGYTDRSMRVVVSTANLYEDDWRNRSQGIWISPRCYEMKLQGHSSNGESVTGFRGDLIRYLNKYNQASLQEWTARIQRIDFSAVKWVERWICLFPFIQCSSFFQGLPRLFRSGQSPNSAKHSSVGPFTPGTPAESTRGSHCRQLPGDCSEFQHWITRKQLQRLGPGNHNKFRSWLWTTASSSYPRLQNDISQLQQCPRRPRRFAKWRWLAVSEGKSHEASVAGESFEFVACQPNCAYKGDATH